MERKDDIPLSFTLFQVRFVLISVKLNTIMNNIRTISFFLFLGIGNVIFAQDVHLMTYNVRFENPGDAPHVWESRLPLILDQINNFGADIIGMQEVLKSQVLDLEEALPEFQRLGVGRDDGKEAGEYSPLFFRKDRFESGAYGTIWLSETPAVVSKGWDAALPRIATWAILTDKKTEKSYLVLNTHFDHVGKQARLESMKLIYSFVTQGRFLDHLSIVMGDLNNGPEEEPYQWLLGQQRFKDSYEVATQRRGPVGTYSGFNYEHISSRIDYIFVDPLLKVKSYQVIQEQKNGVLPSDHWPVMVVIE